MEMNRKSLASALALLLLGGTTSALACDYKAGETKFLSYANCRYGADSVLEVKLANNQSWDSCVYYVEPFRPAKLLAVTKDKNGKEVLSLNDRSQIGNPCYLTKSKCDAALKAHKAGTH
jgi:hypothetical protein